MPDYRNLLKVQDGVISHEPVPDFLTNSQIPVDQIADLTWVGVPEYVGCGWWPIDFQWPAIGPYQSYNDEVLTLDEGRRVVVSTRTVTDWTAAEILAYKASITRHISRLAFRNRLTQPEKIAFEMAQVDDPAAVLTVRETAAALRVMEKDLSAGQYVDLNAAATQAGLAQLEALGIIAAGRADEIIWGDILPIEVP